MFIGDGVQVPGDKGLVLDPKLSGPLGLIAEVALLKDHGVEKIYHLSDRLDTDCKNIVYLIRPRHVMTAGGALTQRFSDSLSLPSRC